MAETSQALHRRLGVWRWGDVWNWTGKHIEEYTESWGSMTKNHMEATQPASYPTKRPPWRAGQDQVWGHRIKLGPSAGRRDPQERELREESELIPWASWQWDHKCLWGLGLAALEACSVAHYTTTLLEYTALSRSFSSILIELDAYQYWERPQTLSRP